MVRPHSSKAQGKSCQHQHNKSLGSSPVVPTSVALVASTTRCGTPASHNITTALRRHPTPPMCDDEGRTRQLHECCRPVCTVHMQLVSLLAGSHPPKPDPKLRHQPMVGLQNRRELTTQMQGEHSPHDQETGLPAAMSHHAHLDCPSPHQHLQNVRAHPPRL
jgi:hypothetical protein